MVCERDNKGRIMVYDRQLKYVREIAGTDIHVHVGRLIDVAPDKHGNLYTVDEDYKCVRVFSNEGKLLRSFHSDSTGANQLSFPSGICVAGQNVYVADSGSNNVFVFTTEGDYVTSFGRCGDKAGEFQIPYGVCIDEDGFLYVCDSGNNRVQIF